MTWGSPHFRVGDKIFGGWGADKDGRYSTSAKLDKDKQAALVASDSRFEVAAYVGKHGWVTFYPGDAPDLGELEALVLESYRNIAPKKLVAQLDGEAKLAKSAAKAKPAGKKPAKAAAKKKPAAKAATAKASTAKAATAKAKPVRQPPKPARAAAARPAAVRATSTKSPAATRATPSRAAAGKSSSVKKRAATAAAKRRR